MKLKNILGIAAGMGTASLITGKKMQKLMEQEIKKVDKFKKYYNLLNQWLALKQQGKSLEMYFLENQYKTIIIYGMGEIGNRLYEELKNSRIEIKYAIDKNVIIEYDDLEIMELSNSMEQADVVVVTAIFAFDEIKKSIEDKFQCDIISLEDVIFEL